MFNSSFHIQMRVGRVGKNKTESGRRLQLGTGSGSLGSGSGSGLLIEKPLFASIFVNVFAKGGCRLCQLWYLLDSENEVGTRRTDLVAGSFALFAHKLCHVQEGRYA